MSCGMQLPPTPPVDPENEEFVLFIRAKKFPQWYPLSVVKGGAQANVLLKAMQNDLGKLLYGKTLIRNIGNVSSLQLKHCVMLTLTDSGNVILTVVMLSCPHLGATMLEGPADAVLVPTRT